MATQNKITDYKIVKDFSPEALEITIKDMLNKGWILYPNFQAINDPRRGLIVYIQPMFKNKSSQKK